MEHSRGDDTEPSGAGGDAARWQQLDRIVRPLVASLVPKAAVEELTEEILVVLALKIARGAMQLGHLGDGYVRVVARRRCKAWLRRDARRRPKPASLEDLAGKEGALWLAAPPPSGDPAEISPERWRQAVAALSRRLTGRDRRVLLRHFVRGVGVRATARSLAISPGQVRRSIRRILRLAHDLRHEIRGVERPDEHE